MTELVWGLPGVDKEKAANRKKPRSLTYTGCWTCRERRVKCDERPVSCGNCDRAKRVCGGYDVRLVWATDERGRPVTRSGHRNAIGRQKKNVTKVIDIDRNININRWSDTEASSTSHVPSPPSLCRSLPNSTLEESNELENTRVLLQGEEWNERLDDSVSQNAFHFADSPLSNTLERMSPSTSTIWNHEPALEGLHDFFQLCVGPSGASEVSVPSLTSLGLGVDALWADPGGFATHDANSIDSSASTNLVPLDFVPIMDDDAEDLPQSSLCGPLLPSTAVEFAPSLDHELAFREPPSTILLREFSEHLCCFMQSIPHRDTPFRNIYLSTALDGFRFLDTGQTRTQLSLASVSVYHSISAVAAINLGAHVSSSSRAYIDKIACLHRTKGLEAARGALTGKISSYRHVLTAILCLVSVDIIDGGVKDHWIHLEAATSLQKSRQKLTLISRQTQQLNTICSMLSLFAQTAIYNHSSLPWQRDLLAADERTQDGFSNCVEFLYGTTPTITKAIFKTLRLSQFLNFYRNQVLPEAFLEACEDLHDELLSWNVDSECFSTVETTEASMMEMMRAQAIAFYNSTLIYYYRSIQNCHRRDLAREQQEVLAAMNLVEDIKVSSRDQRYSAAPITWPAFIASCEAIGPDRSAWARWWDRAQSYRMANYVKQRSIIDSVWARIDSHDDTKDWREILSSMGVRVIPV